MTPLDDLIARLASATEGSRELDAAIFRLTGLTEAQERHCRDWCRMDGRTDLTREHYIGAWAPNYSTSIDHALTLLPEEWTWTVDRRYGDRHPGRYWGAAHLVPDRPGRDFWNDAQTPALALCIACLRARSTLPETEG